MSNYSDYAAFCETTAIYPEHVAAEYLALGLCSEAAECVELFVTEKRRDTMLPLLIGAECGDVQWYVARKCALYGFEFGQVVSDAKRAYLPCPYDVSMPLTELTVETGLIAGKVKKQLRDGANWNGEQREDARQYIRDRLVRIVVLSMQVTDKLHEMGAHGYGSYDKLLGKNIEKLSSRKARGALGGDGDNR